MAGSPHFSAPGWVRNPALPVDWKGEDVRPQPDRFTRNESSVTSHTTRNPRAPMKHTARARKELRILWSSNSVTTTSGYGTQSRNILYRMLDAGYATAHVAFAGIEAGIFQLEGLKDASFDS